MSLRNIITGVVAQDCVNVDDYRSVGTQIIEKIRDSQFSRRRKKRVRILGDASSVEITPKKPIDLALLYQWLLEISNTRMIHLENVLYYKFGRFPPY